MSEKLRKLYEMESRLKEQIKTEEDRIFFERLKEMKEKTSSNSEDFSCHSTLRKASENETISCH